MYHKYYNYLSIKAFSYQDFNFKNLCCVFNVAGTNDFESCSFCFIFSKRNKQLLKKEKLLFPLTTRPFR